MKKIIVLIFITFLAINLKAQLKLEFATIDKDGRYYKNIPRLSFDWGLLSYDIIGLQKNKKEMMQMQSDTSSQNKVQRNNERSAMRGILGIIKKTGNPLAKSKIFGLTAGLAIINTGFIYQDDSLKKKVIDRALGLSVPIDLTIKLGKNFKVFVGHNFTYNIYYKEKTFDDGNSRKDKTKTEATFSDRINRYYPSLEFGVNTKFFTLSIIYNYQDFFNKDFTVVGDNYYKPYQHLKVTNHYAVTMYKTL